VRDRAPGVANNKPHVGHLRHPVLRKIATIVWQAKHSGRGRVTPPALGDWMWGDVDRAYAD
jgi:hypothetical protein